MLTAENPHLAIIPDFTLAEHEEARAHLVTVGLTNEQAVHSLAALWTISNNTARECRNNRPQQVEAEGGRRAEEDAARLEERKKNKSKYAPVRHANVPSDPVVLPSPYATRKLGAGGFCELYYFTNKGLEDARKSLTIAEPEALVTMPSTNGLHSSIPAGAVKDPKSAVTKDENISWEEFNESTPRMISAMKVHDWPQDRIDMHIQFWSALQTHRWRHALDPLKQRALLLYQGQQRRKWHLYAGSSESWSLEVLNEQLLIEAREDLFNEQRTQQTALAIHVSLSSTCSLLQWLTIYLNLYPLYTLHIACIFPPCWPPYADNYLFTYASPYNVAMNTLHHALSLHGNYAPMQFTKPTILTIMRPSQEAAAAYMANNPDLLRAHMPAVPQRQRPAATHMHLPATTLKRALAPMEDEAGSKKVRLSRALPASGILPCCAVCLGRRPHRTVECVATHTWNKQHETFAERIRKALWTRDGKQICTAWQREEGCILPKHETRHICSGCGATQHGAQQCPRAEKAMPTDSV